MAIYADNTKVYESDLLKREGQKLTLTCTIVGKSWSIALVNTTFVQNR